AVLSTLVEPGGQIVARARRHRVAMHRGSAPGGEVALLRSVFPKPRSLLADIDSTVRLCARIHKVVAMPRSSQYVRSSSSGIPPVFLPAPLDRATLRSKPWTHMPHIRINRARGPRFQAPSRAAGTSRFARLGNGDLG